ncbi:carbon-nitrogen hydrolase [Pseudomassariella vexata]|uniref:Carbon-nitrogen hydrolase n=1 Tax=Pseudomassariella vexata TaxID=1141098 RepID=A0A1Y2EA72_9PEZI|nr:carbon-nitrogen hydrolase [Pseudomassariella vexata]ORY68459.1 carbon-nitrogen hydrolase [Pseudomassariella vexata]
MPPKPEPRLLTVAAAQLGPNQKATPRAEILDRMLKLVDEAAAAGVKLIAFPELALTTFFPTQLMSNPDEIASYFEPASPADPYGVLSTPHAKPLVDKANSLGIDFYLGYAERWTADGKTTDYNATLYYSSSAKKAIAKYRKVHLPGTKEPIDGPEVFQQLEKRYFTPGNLGFEAFRAPGLVEGALKAEDVSEEKLTAIDGKGDPILGMLICNDRRWPEAWRPYGLQGVELVIEGYNTTAWAPQHSGTPEEQQALAEFHHKLSCQAGSYQNACWSLHVAKCGVEDGIGMIAGSMIVDPNGRVVAESKTMGDELVVATIDLAMCRSQKERVFNFERHRRVENYGIILAQVGAKEIPLLSRA